MLSLLYFFVAPQLLAIASLLLLRRWSVLATLLAGPALATVSGWFVMHCNVQLDTFMILHPDRYVCGLAGLSAGLVPFVHGAMHGVAAFVLSGIFVLRAEVTRGGRPRVAT